MDVHEQRTVLSMSTAVADLKQARADAQRLVIFERNRGTDAEFVLPEVARAVGAAPGTIENILRKRVKAVAGWLRDRLAAAVIRELHAEIQRLEHELQVARLRSARPDSQQVASAVALVERAKQLLAEAIHPPTD